MPSLTSTIEDFSPLIQYSANWREGSSADSLASLYSQSSFTLTNTDGASASFTFNGTGVQLFGSKRGNHGFYQVQVDGVAFPAINGANVDPGSFQDVLFSTDTLSQGEHELIVTNQGDKFFDIDFITWQSTIGRPDETLTVTTVQDTDPAFVYAPANAWSTNPTNLGTFFGGSGRVTASAGAFVEYTFTASDAVSLYGPVGPQGSPYAVQLDNTLPTNYTSNKIAFMPQVLLYHANNLGRGRHSLKVFHNPIQSDQVLAIDYANVFSTPSTGGSGGTGQRSNSLPGGAIAGIVISILLLIIGLVCIVLYMRRRREKRSSPSFESALMQPPQTEQHNKGLSIDTSGYSYQSSMIARNGTMSTRAMPMPGSHLLSGQDTQRTFPETPYSWQSEPNVSPEAIYPPFTPGGLTYPASIYPQSDYSAAMPSSAASTVTRSYSRSRASRGHVPTAGRPLPPSPPSLPIGSTTYNKGEAVQVPETAGQSLHGISEEELRQNRMIVEGRDQDYGTVPYSTMMAPPNYLQATEPYDAAGPSNNNRI